MTRKFRYLDGKVIEVTHASATTLRCEVEHVSDIGLGFTSHQLPEMENHLKQSGCRGISFEPDPDPELRDKWVRVHADSPRALEEYTQKRGFFNKTGGKSGCSITPHLLQQAEEFVKRRR